MIITPILIIFMFVVFLLLFLFLNTVDRRKWLTILTSLILTPFAYYYVFYPFINIISSYHHQKYFNSEAWIDKPALRYEMIDQTIESDTLIGLSKSKIEEILGKHEWLSWDDAKKDLDENKWNYGIGIEPGAFNNQKECAELQFKNDTLIKILNYQEEITFNKEDE